MFCGFFAPASGERQWAFLFLFLHEAQHRCWLFPSGHLWKMQHTLERRRGEVAEVESRPPLGRWGGSLAEGRRHEQKSLTTHHTLTAAHFASMGPGMGLIACFPYMISGILPRPHICRSQPVPLQRRVRGGQVNSPLYLSIATTNTWAASA